MNTPKKTDFIPEIAPQDAHLVAPDTYQPYRDDEEDRLHEERLKEIEAQLNENSARPNRTTNSASCRMTRKPTANDGTNSKKISTAFLKMRPAAQINNKKFAGKLN
jgi:hypothetical protein